MFGLCKSCIKICEVKFNHLSRCDLLKVKCNDNCNTTSCCTCREARKLANDKCEKCYNFRNSGCNRTDSERPIAGFWTTCEINEAIKKDIKYLIFMFIT